MKKNKKLPNITDFEQEILNALIYLLSEEKGFSDVEVKEIASLIEHPVAATKGGVGSLIKKGVLYVDDDKRNFGGIIYLHNDYHHLHPVWCKELKSVLPGDEKQAIGKTYHIDMDFEGERLVDDVITKENEHNRTGYIFVYSPKLRADIFVPLKELKETAQPENLIQEMNEFLDTLGNGMNKKAAQPQPEVKHTEGEMEAHGNWVGLKGQSSPIALTSGEKRHADAAELVKRWNAHPEIMQMVSDLLEEAIAAQKDRYTVDTQVKIERAEEGDKVIINYTKKKLLSVKHLSFEEEY